MASPTVDFSADMAAVFASLQADGSLALTPAPGPPSQRHLYMQYALFRHIPILCSGAFIYFRTARGIECMMSVELMAAQFLGQIRQ